MASKLNLNSISLEELKAKVNALPEAGTGGTDTSDATATADDIVVGETAYVNGVKLTGTNPYEKTATDTEVNNQSTLLSQAVATLFNKTAVSPRLQTKGVNSSTSTQEIVPDSGYDGLSKVVVSAMNLQTKAASPSVDTVVVEPDLGYHGLAQVTIEGDANFVPENIAEGVSVFGVIGTHVGGSSGGIETCSIRIVCNTESIYGYSYLAYRDEQLTPVVLYNVMMTNILDVTLPDVVCGSLIHIQASGYYDFLDVSTSGTVTVEKLAVPNRTAPAIFIYASNEANSTSTVTITDNE